MKTQQLMSEFGNGLSEINQSDGTGEVPTARAKEIKHTISSAYDLSAYLSDAGAIWNWGMQDEDLLLEIQKLIPGFPGTDTDGFSEQLYYLALREIPIGLDGYSGKSILEVGCGLGEGLNFLSRLVPGASMVGLDLSPNAVERANTRLARGSALHFVPGDAEQLPFADGELDAVVNVESSHTYPDLGRFFAEVARVLKPGGYFSHIDLFTAPRYEQMTRLKEASSELDWIHERDISAPVRTAISQRMAADSRFRKSFQAKRMPWLARKLGERMRMVTFGAHFIGYTGDRAAVRLLKVAGLLPSSRVLTVESYRHHVARRVLR